MSSRGDRRETIYRDEQDRTDWLGVLGGVCERFNWRCHAYCEMTNHSHFVMETPEANLSKGMRQLNGVYTQRFNRRHGRVGHLFQGRFKAILVERDAYLLELARYVVLAENRYFNGHPDLVVQGVYPENAVKAGSEGVEIKTTRKSGGAVEIHGAREQWMCVFVHSVDTATEPARDREAMTFKEVYLGNVGVEDFRKNARSELGTRTATLHKDGIKKLRENWIYRL